jgi:hypothetical protein
LLFAAYFAACLLGLGGTVGADAGDHKQRQPEESHVKNSFRG